MTPAGQHSLAPRYTLYASWGKLGVLLAAAVLAMLVGGLLLLLAAVSGQTAPPALMGCFTAFFLMPLALWVYTVAAFALGRRPLVEVTQSGWRLRTPIGGRTVAWSEITRIGAYRFASSSRVVVLLFLRRPAGAVEQRLDVPPDPSAPMTFEPPLWRLARIVPLNLSYLRVTSEARLRMLDAVQGLFASEISRYQIEVDMAAPRLLRSQNSVDSWLEQETAREMGEGADQMDGGVGPHAR